MKLRARRAQLTNQQKMGRGMKYQSAWGYLTRLRTDTDTSKMTWIRVLKNRNAQRRSEEMEHWAGCASSPSGSCAATQGLVEKQGIDTLWIPHSPPLGPRSTT